jgi:hypothetical protein
VGAATTPRGTPTTPYRADEFGRPYEPHDLAEPIEPLGPEPGAPPGRLETILVYVVSAAAFFAIGYQIVVVDHVVVFDALDRLTRAYLVWHNDPPKLAAIGFVFPPITTLVFIPFAVIKPLATSLIALPLMSCLFMAGMAVMVDRTLARCEMPVLLRLPMLLLFLASPMIVFYGGNGMSEAVYLFFLGWAIYCFIAWYLTVQPRFLIGAGIAMSLAVLTRYGFVWWALTMAILVGAALIRRARVRDEVEGSVIAFGAPIIYALTLWTLFNAIIVGDPINWITSSNQTLAVNAVGHVGQSGVDLAEVSRRLLDVIVHISPLALVALPLLLVAFVAARSDMALWLAVFIALGVVVEGANALIKDQAGTLLMRDAMPVMLCAIFGAAWLYRMAGGLRIAVWAGTMVILAVTLPLTWDSMKHYPYQNQEQAFVRAVQTGKDQEGKSSIGGFNVGIGPEAQMAAYLQKVASKQHDVLTDNAQTFGVMLLNGRPQDFVDRADKGDAKWKSVLRDPNGKVSYMLVARNSSGDLIRQSYPGIVKGTDPRFPTAFVTDRYILARVPPKQR